MNFNTCPRCGKTVNCCCCYVGATGPTGSSIRLRGIQIQGTTLRGALIAEGNPILMNNVLASNNPNLSYNPLTGEITTVVPGTYYASWWVSVDGTADSDTVEIAIQINGAPNVVTSTMPIVTGQLSGSALLNIDSALATLRLINSSDTHISLGTTSVQANLVVLEAIV